MQIYLSALFVFVLICISSCKDSPDSVLREVSLNGEKITEIHLDNIPSEVLEFKLSDLFSDFQIISLETKTECLIGFPTIKFSHDYIFVGSQTSINPAQLFRFKMNGDFINEIGKGGSGPNEHLGYFVGQTMPIDDDSTILVTWQGRGEHPQIYQYDGTFIEKVIKPMILIGNIYKWSDNLWFSTGVCAGNPEYPRDSIKLVFYDNKGAIHETIPRLKYPDHQSDDYTPWSGSNAVYKIDDYWKVYISGVDTIFKIIDRKLIPTEVLVKGKDGMPFNSYININDLEGKYDLKILAETDHNFLIQKQIQRKVNATQYQPGKWNVRSAPEYQLIIIDKKSKKASYAKLVDDVFHFIPNELLDGRLEWQNTNRVFLSLQAMDYLRILKETELLSNQSSEIKSQTDRLTIITEDSNPIILTFNLKDKIKL